MVATGIDLGLSWGSILAGTFISLVFYGISILQTFIYYVQYPKDKISLKLLVALVFVLDTLHQFLACAGIWQYLVKDYGDFAGLIVMHVPLLLATVVTSLVSFIVQSYFVFRIWVLSTSRFKLVVPVVLLPFVVAQPVLSIYYTTQGLLNPTIEAVGGPLLTKVANASNGTAAAVDVTIAIAMCTLLAMGRTGFNEKTDRMLLRLIVMSVNTGLWTAFFAFLAVILLVTLPSDLVFSGVYFPLCTVYCNTLLANLNVRTYIRGGDRAEAYHLPSVPSSDRYRSGRSATPINSLPLNISVETSKHTELDSFEERKVPMRGPFRV